MILKYLSHPCAYARSVMEEEPIRYPANRADGICVVIGDWLLLRLRLADNAIPSACLEKVQQQESIAIEGSMKSKSIRWGAASREISEKTSLRSSSTIGPVWNFSRSASVSAKITVILYRFEIHKPLMRMLYRCGVFETKQVDGFSIGRITC